MKSALSFGVIAAFTVFVMVDAQKQYPQCIATDCMDFLAIATKCGYDGTSDTMTDTQKNCICNASGILTSYQTCAACLVLDPSNTVTYDSWPSGCSLNSGSPSVSSVKASIRSTTTTVRTSISATSVSTTTSVSTPSAVGVQPVSGSVSGSTASTSTGPVGLPTSGSGLGACGSGNGCGKGDASANTYKNPQVVSAGMRWVLSGGYYVLGGLVVVHGLGWL